MTSPPEDPPSEIDELRGDIARYRDAWRMHDDAKFRAAVAAIIAELERRLDFLTGGGDAP